MIERRVVVRCDSCGKPFNHDGNDALLAVHNAERRGWRAVPLHYTGIAAHFCPGCAAGKDDKQLVERVMKGDR